MSGSCLYDPGQTLRVGDIVECQLDGYRGLWFVTSFQLGHNRVELDRFPRDLSYTAVDAQYVRLVEREPRVFVDRAISLTQPWVGLMATGIKPIENRNRPLISPKNFGKPIALHATREIDKDVIKRAIEIAPEIMGAGKDVVDLDWFKLGHITSAIVAVATPVALIKGFWRSIGEQTELCYPPTNLPRETTRWMFGEHCYLFRDAKVLPTAIPIGGKQGCWPLPLEVTREIMRQLS